MVMNLSLDFLCCRYVCYFSGYFNFSKKFEEKVCIVSLPLFSSQLGFGVFLLLSYDELLDAFY